MPTALDVLDQTLGRFRPGEWSQKLTILGAVDIVLSNIGRPAHAREIRAAIEKARLYQFGAVDPDGVVARKINENIASDHPRYERVKPNTFAFLKMSQLLSPEVQQAVARADEQELERALGSLGDEEFQRWAKSAVGDASVQVTQGLIKVRRYQRSIIAQLKAQYQGTCQICGWSALTEFKVDVSEAHHIEYFSKSLNNKPSNIAVLCPTHHALVHATAADFNRETKAFVCADGTELRITRNLHL